MATWQVISGGTTYNLSDRNPFDVVAVSGVGLAPVRRLSQRGPLQHGETDLGYRLDARSINLVLAISAASLTAADTARDTLAALFGPLSDAPLALRCTRDDGEVRQIDCYAVGLVDAAVGGEDRIGVYQRVGVQLWAPDPLWYDPTPTLVDLSELAGDWWTGGGLIDAGDVLDYRTDVSAPTSWIGAGVPDMTPWSIIVRTKRDDSGIYPNYLWGARIYSDPPEGIDYGMYGRYIPSTDQISTKLSTSAPIQVALADDNLHTFVWVMPASASSTFFIDDVGYNMAIFGKGFKGGPRYWAASLDGANAYGQTLAYAAAYKIALTNSQRMAVRALIEGWQVLMVTNGGNAPAFPVIQLGGPMTNPVLTNQATGLALGFDITLAADDTLTIDTRYGHKTVIDQLGANRIATLTPESDLAAWHLSPGDNALEIVVDDVTYTGSATLTWNDRYLSL